MAKDKHLPPPPQKNRENSSTDKTPEFGTFNDLEWDLLDEVDFGHKKFIKVALINKAYAGTASCNPEMVKGNCHGSNCGHGTGGP